MNEGLSNLPGQMTTERLQSARGLLANLVLTKPEEVTDGLILADKLQGVSRAISSVVISRHGAQATLPRGVEDPELATYSFGMMRPVKHPTAMLGRLFTAHALPYGKASMKVSKWTIKEPIPLWDITIPSDKEIDDLLVQDPALWTKRDVRVQDRRGEDWIEYRPFSSRHYEIGDTQKYFDTLRIMTTELLDQTRSSR